MSTPLVNQFQWHVQPQSGQLMHVVADLTVKQCSLKWKINVKLWAYSLGLKYHLV